MKQTPEYPAAIILVKETLKALGDIAGRIRHDSRAKLVGITGSNGKTTVKELCAAILETQGPTLKTDKNYNNLIGVPLCLFKMHSEHRFAVIEMGTNRPGEIGRLSQIADPDIAILTNINHAHLNGLGSIEGIIAEKQSIFSNTRNGGFAIINPTLPYIDQIKIPDHLQILTFAEEGQTDVRLKDILRSDLSGTDFIASIAGRETRMHISLPGMHNVTNALAACACGLALNIDPEAIAAGIAGAAFPGMRSEIIISEHMTIINDTYNASPASMDAALKMLGSAPHSSKVAILGDMLELGDDSRDLHQQLGRNVASSHIDRLVVTGTMARIVADAAIEAGMDATAIDMVADIEDIKPLIGSINQKDACVLVKASRALQLDRVVNYLKAVA